MALLERVGSLLRADLDELIGRSEEPGRVLKQLILDIENQLMQVKTQVAIGIGEMRRLERKAAEAGRKRGEWMRKAQQAVTKKQDGAARAAIERSLEAKKLAEGLASQAGVQKNEVEAFKSALGRLEIRLGEARGKSVARPDAVKAGPVRSAAAPVEKNGEIERLLGELKAARGRRL